jgi:hypothetical protein
MGINRNCLHISYLAGVLGRVLVHRPMSKLVSIQQIKQ